ncbi:MAG: cyclic nucleotide-binding domain-containing protein, partial [Rhodothermales bacterium]|nr:cyclic nucleotide-binding domain-containing protein [Rhodothermales bacterium]
MDAPAAQTDAAARERRRLYEDRWSSYGSNTGIVRLSENLTPEALRRYPVFQDYDDRFLLKIIPDVAVATWKAGAVLFEEGSYLDLAFYIGEGDVDVFLARDLGSSGARPIFDASRVALHPDAPLANGDTARTTFMEQIARQQPQADQSVTYLSAMDFDLPRGERLRLGPGDVFGEIGALNGWPQSVTARTATECTLVQIRLPALREMK